MRPMDQLFEIYNCYFDQLEATARQLDDFYPKPAQHSLRRKSREEFAAFVDGPPSEAKRQYLSRLLKNQDQLLNELPQHIQSFVRRAA